MIQTKLEDLREELKKRKIDFLEKCSTWNTKSTEAKLAGNSTTPLVDSFHYLTPVVETMTKLILAYSDYVNALEKKYLKKVKHDSKGAQKSL
ncbi:MAG: hypothetical protein ACT4N5_01470 [Nitrosopumilaceae archaeon]